MTLGLSSLNPGKDAPESVAGLKTGLVFLLIFALGISLRVWGTAQNMVLSRDGIAFVTTVSAHTQMGGSTPDGLLSLLHFGAGMGIAPETFGKALSLAAGILLLPAAWMIGRLVFGSGSGGNILSFLCAVNPKLVDYSIQVQKESVFLFLLSLSLICALEAVQNAGLSAVKQRWFWGAAGFLLLLSAGIRHEGIEYIFYYILLIVWMARGKPHPGVRIGSECASLLTGICIGACLVGSMSRSLAKLFARFQ